MQGVVGAMVWWWRLTAAGIWARCWALAVSPPAWATAIGAGTGVQHPREEPLRRSAVAAAHTNMEQISLL